MGLSIDIEKVEPTAEIEVLVQFQTPRGTTVQGSYFGTFVRPSQEELQELLDPDQEYKNNEVLEKYLKSVRGVGKGGIELPAEEQLDWVMKTPECVSAGAVAYLKAFRPARYDEKTSKKRR